ncbi:MAG: hypothetical protein JO083_01655 [Candidatus Eremiobacteraeota bacterium]|nr:hypothetical protein [Candidatus Eremiobacteraeota bacterium]
MTIFFRLAGAATLCAAVLLAGCAKKTDQTTTTSTSTTATDASPAAGTAPDAAASASAVGSAAPTTAATPGPLSVSVKTSAPAAAGANGYINLPVYPGAAENKDQDISSSGNGVTVTLQVYSTKDDAKTVADWYKSHLPASWKGGILTAGGKTIGTFSNEMSDGDQSVVVASDTSATRIQLTTKHGK